MTAAGAEPVYEGKDKIYYRLSDGTLGNEHWERKGQDWYYVGEDGHILKDNVIVAYDDNYYVLDESGRMLRSRTIFKNGLSYVIDENGVAKPEETEEELILREYASSIMANITNDSMTQDEEPQS